MRKQSSKKYEGFSLVEMLITIAIMGTIMIISSSVLSTLIRVSTVASNKIRARNESEFVLELMRRTIRNSDPSDVYVFRSNVPVGIHEGRKFLLSQQRITGTVDDTVYEEGLPPGEIGNEIQFRPYGFSGWLCLGFFYEEDDPEKGYILWTSGENLKENHESCFDVALPYSYLMVLNSDYINVKDFQISYTESSDGNYIIEFDIISEPANWYLGPRALIKPEVYRRGVVSTEGVIW
jgi:prepilin-type N-terminal cleavage/methylation domain-containing protein